MAVVLDVGPVVAVLVAGLQVERRTAVPAVPAGYRCEVQKPYPQ